MIPAVVDYRDNPPVHIFADTDAALARMRVTAEAAGSRIVSSLLIGDTADPSAIAVPGAAILIELEDEGAGEPAISLLDWLRREAERGRRRAVISAPAGLIDLIAARAAHPDIAHLCAAEEAERVTAVGCALQPNAPWLRDVGPESVRVLQPSPGYVVDVAGPHDAAFIRTLIRIRRMRGNHFPAGLFADPVWDMLLDLMAARLEGKKVAISSLCIAAAVPPTTALRWIGVLTEQGLVVRVADPHDGRRVHVELADATARALGVWLREARRMTAEAE